MHRASVQAARVAVEKARTNEFRELVQRHAQLNHRKRKLEADNTANHTSPPSPPSFDAAAASILAPITPPSAFTQSALLIRQSISDIQRLLQSQQRDYLDTHRHLTSAQSRMSDADRDTLELTLARSIAAIAQQLDSLKQATTPPPPTLSALFDAALSSEPLQSAEVHAGSVWAHRSEVVLCLYDELRRVTEFMARMKDERRRQKQEQADTMHPPSFRQYSAHAAAGEKEEKRQDAAKSGKEEKVEENAEKRKQDSKSGIVTNTNQWARLAQHDDHKAATQPPAVVLSARPASTIAADDSASLATEAPPVFSQQLEQENAQLFSSLSTNLSQLHQAESSASSIAQLLSLFHSRVLEQSEQIERIEGNVVDSVALVERGVEQLRKAASRGASFRMMVMFMILLLSFCLLFLDWYYP